MKKNPTLNIETTNSFELILQLLIEKQHHKQFEPFKLKLPTFIKTVSDFARIFNYLSEKQRAELIRAC